MRPQSAPRRVAVALSGGVDSGVAALLLVERGLDVTALTLQLRSGPERPSVPTPAAIERARAMAERLEIPFRLIDARDSFEREVVDTFVAEYAAGRTPNPCVTCNRFIRFGLLMDRARALGAEALATGHYSRIRWSDGKYQLLRGVDPTKDQSYFLHALTQSQLARALFPLGSLTKNTVREIALRNRLPVAEQPESQDVCFIAGGDYRQFLERHAPNILKPGPIYDTAGKVLGQHNGLAAYTIGQRKGLQISAAKPLYVLAIKPDENALIVGTADQLGRDKCRVDQVHFISGRIPNARIIAEAQIRYQAAPTRVTVYPISERQIEVRFDVSQRDITPGQFLVLYRGDLVLGGGIICDSRTPVL